MPLVSASERRRRSTGERWRQLVPLLLDAMLDASQKMVSSSSMSSSRFSIGRARLQTNRRRRYAAQGATRRALRAGTLAPRRALRAGTLAPIVLAETSCADGGLQGVHTNQKGPHLVQYAMAKLGSMASGALQRLGSPFNSLKKATRRVRRPFIIEREFGDGDARAVHLPGPTRASQRPAQREREHRWQ